MSENKLKLNPDKTEFIVFGAKDRHKWLSDSLPVNILGNCLSPADVVRNLGVLFDAKFCFTNHVNSVIKSCFISLRDLHRIRRFLSVDTSVVIANALVSSRLDYCNYLFRSLSSRNATRLQYVQNALARFVTGASKYTHITSTLRTLHWLPVRQRIIFKTLVLVYKYLTTGQPKYFAPYLPLYKSAMNTRRSNPKNLFLLVPSYCPSIHKSKVHFNNIVSHMMPLSYGMIFHMIYAVLQISPVSKVDSKPTYFRNHSHHSFLLPNTGPPPWQRLGTCLMSHDLCLTDWMVCLRIR